ncbi:MAG: hypothetical protein M1819_006971 [Sarea resinae]|nr:MAG: hypothetical protein M1819_006971 [Sarea resinae]
MSFSLQDQQRVFLAYRALFEGSNAQLRKQKKIKQLAQSHKKSSKTLVQALGLDRIVIILKHLLERGIFESESRARKAFPLLFQTTAKQNAQHSALEIGAANLEAQALEGAEAMDQINCDRDDEDEDLGDDEDLFDKYRPHGMHLIVKG